MWERIDAEKEKYQILNEAAFQKQIRSFADDYFEQLTHIDPITREAFIKHTLLIDDDFLNIALAKKEGYLTYRSPITGIDFSDWENIVNSIENDGVQVKSSC